MKRIAKPATTVVGVVLPVKLKARMRAKAAASGNTLSGWLRHVATQALAR